MESNDKLKEVDIKNCTCYYSDDIIKIEGFDLNHLLTDEKSYENILLHDISMKFVIDSKPLRIILEKIDVFIRVYDGTRYLVLFASETCYSIYKRIRHLLSVKSGITYIFLIIMQKLNLIHTMDFSNVIILIKSVWNKDKNNYYYIIFLEKLQMNYLKNKFLYKIEMLYYNKIDVSDGTDINKTSASKECDICHYSYVLNKGFKFKTYVCNRSHDLLTMPMKLNNIAILKIENADYCCISSGISKSEAILQNIPSTEKN